MNQPTVTAAELARAYDIPLGQIPARCAHCGEHHDIDAISCDDPALLASTAAVVAARRGRSYRIGQRLLVDGRTPCTVVTDYGDIVDVRYYPSLDTERVARERLSSREKR